MFCVLEYLGLLFLLLCVRYLGSGADPFTCPGTFLSIEYNRYWEYSPLGVKAPCLERAPSTNLLCFLSAERPVCQAHLEPSRVHRGGMRHPGNPGVWPEAPRGVPGWPSPDPLGPPFARGDPSQPRAGGRGRERSYHDGTRSKWGRPQPPPTYP